MKKLFGLVAVVLVIAAMAPSASIAGASRASSKEVVSRRLPQQSAAALRAYWTRQRMRRAPLRSVSVSHGRTTVVTTRPTGASTGVTRRASANASPVPISDYTTYPTSTSGRLFGTDENGQNYACSGTSIHSVNGGVVWTAGHCVIDPHSNALVQGMVFVPGYDNGNAPLGVWLVRGYYIPLKYLNEKDEAYDYAALIVSPISGETLVGDVGGREISFNNADEASTVYDAFGYPADPPFDGETMQTCSSGVVARDDTVNPAALGISCDMNEGSSGGGFIIHGTNALNSNIAYGKASMPGIDFGPYLDSTAQGIFEDAEKSTYGGPLPSTEPPATPVAAPHMPTTDETPPAVTKVFASPARFKATSCKASSRNFTKLAWTVNEATYETIILFRGKLGYVTAFNGLDAGSWYTKWTGCNRKNRLVSAGTYKYVLEAHDTSGNVTKVIGKVTVTR